jgi:hypothetical protein
MKSNLIGAGALGKSHKNLNDLNEKISLLFRNNYAQSITEWLFELGIRFRNRVYTPFNTLWIFISQILSSDQSCRNGVAMFISSQDPFHLQEVSYSTGGYCLARKRLPVELFKRLFRKITENIGKADNHEWLWHGKNVKLVDGTTVALERTSDIQKVFPAHKVKKNGDPGTPTARIVAAISLSTGAIIDAVIGPSRGKHTAESVIFNDLLPNFNAEDLLVFDRFFSGFFNLWNIIRRRCSFVARQNQRRKHFSVLKILGHGDRLTQVPRPPRFTGKWWATPFTYDKSPKYIILREITFQIARPGFRTRHIVLITNLLDEKTFPKSEIEDLYRQRWNIEVDFRSIKQELNMAHLRSKTAAMVEKEIWMHLVTYNLIRAVMLVTAQFHSIHPRTISFKAVLQLFASLRLHSPRGLQDEDFLMIATKALLHKVGNRPDRAEPRIVMRDKRHYPFHSISRNQWKKEHGLI